MKKEIEEFATKYPTTFSKLDTNQRLDIEFFLKAQHQEIIEEIEKLRPCQFCNIKQEIIKILK